MKRTFAVLMILALVVTAVPVAADDYTPPPDEYTCYMAPDTPGCETAQPTPEPMADPYASDDYACMMDPAACAPEPTPEPTLNLSTSITLTDTDGITTTFSFDPGEWLPTSNSDPCGGYYQVDWNLHGLQTTMTDGFTYTTVMTQICVDTRTGAETATYTVCPGACGVGLVPVIAWDSTGDGQPAQAGVVGSMFWRMCLEGVGKLPKGGPALQLIDGVCLMLAWLTDTQGVCAVSTSLLVAVTHLKAHTTDLTIQATCGKLQVSLGAIMAASCQAAAGP